MRGEPHLRWHFVMTCPPKSRALRFPPAHLRPGFAKDRINIPIFQKLAERKKRLNLYQVQGVG